MIFKNALYFILAICCYSNILLAKATDSALLEATKNWNFKYELVETRENRSFQKKIDTAYEKIFSTKASASICALFLKNNTNIIRKVTGVSQYSAQLINESCSKITKIKNPVVEIEGRVRTFFVFTDHSNFPIQGWSNTSGHTFIFFKNKESITEEDLVRSLVHELIIRLDLKNFFRFYVAISNFDNDRLLQTLETRYVPTDKCRAYSVFFNPLLRTHFIAERARNIELAVLKEIYNDNSKSSYDQLSCTSKIINNLSQLSAIENVFNTNSSEEDFAYEFRQSSFNCSKEGKAERLLNDIAFLNKEKIFFNNREQNLCQYFSEPWLQILPQFLNSGPGPRIGGGTRSMYIDQLSNQIEKMQSADQDDIKNKLNSILDAKIEDFYDPK